MSTLTRALLTLFACGIVSGLCTEAGAQGWVPQHSWAYAFQLNDTQDEPVIPTETIPQKLEMAIVDLQSDKFIRIRTSDGNDISGQFQGRSDASLGVESAEQQKQVQVEQIEAHWVRGRSTKTGLIVGGVSLGIVGGLVGIAACELGNQEGADISLALCIAGGAALGFVAGGIIGSGIGYLIPTWHQKY